MQRGAAIVAASLWGLGSGLGCATPGAPPGTDAAEPSEPLGVARSFQTVGEAVDGSCSTESVRGLSLQIIEQGACIVPGAFTEVPDLDNVSFGENVFPYLEEPARDALVAAAGATSMSITFNSMLRTVAQQYLLHRWDLQGRCGIAIAATPGSSNHETGLAFDTSQYAEWRSLLEDHGFRWYGSGDPVHFDYVGPGAVDHRGVDVRAFQELWNRNHPDDPIDADGVWGPQTEARMQQAPAEGFPLGADCGEPPPAGPDVTTTISAVDGADVFQDGASASIVDLFEGEQLTIAIRVHNRGGQVAGSVTVALELDDPWLEGAGASIETDAGHPGDFAEDPSVQIPEGASGELPRRVELALGDLGAGETRRITLSVSAAATSVQQALQPAVRTWVREIAGRYGQAEHGGEVTGDGSQTFNGGRLEAALPLDVYGRTRWEFETDRREGWAADGDGLARVASGSLTAEGAARSPALELGGASVVAVRVRGRRAAGAGEAAVVLLESPDAPLREGTRFPLELPEGDALGEVVVDTSAADFVPRAIAVDPDEGGAAELTLDWVRLDLGGPGEDGDGPRDGDDERGQGGGDGADDLEGGCDCRAAGGGGRARGARGVGLLLAGAWIRRRARRGTSARSGA